MSVFKVDEDAGLLGVDPDVVFMTMQASQCPVLIRRDPEGDWWVLVQAPPGVLHAMTVIREAAIIEGFPTAFDAALDAARRAAAQWVPKAGDDDKGFQVTVSYVDGAPHPYRAEVTNGMRAASGTPAGALRMLAVMFDGREENR